MLVWALILLSAFFIFFTLSSKDNNGVAKLWGKSPLVILSGSMKGAGPDNFQQGDLVIIGEIADYSALKVGDIISFWDIIENRRVLNTHRIIEIVEDGSVIKYVTKGDANPLPDPEAKIAGDIVGVYQSKIPALGHVVSFFNSKWGFLICLVFPLFIFFVWRLIKLVMAAIDYRKAVEQEKQSEAAALPGDPPAPAETDDDAP